MSVRGPSRRIAPPHDLGRKQGTAEIDGQPSIAEGVARDPRRTRRRAALSDFGDKADLR